MGVQLIAIGLLGELLTRIYHEPQAGRNTVARRPAPAREDKPRPRAAFLSKTGIKILRFIAASCLLAAVIWYANPTKLVKTLSGVELRWFALAVAAAILANIASALRWAHIARLFSLTAPALPLIAIYGRVVMDYAFSPAQP